MELLEFITKLQFKNNIWILIIPFATMVLDYVSGIMHAWINGILQSKKMRSGLVKKVGEVMILVLGELVTYGLGLPMYIVQVLALYIVFMEVISIMENLQLLGVPIPKFIASAFSKANDAIDSGNISFHELTPEEIKMITKLLKGESDEE